MRFGTALIEGRLVRRYKRFFADVELADGALVTAHCANTGAMTGVAEPGLRVWLSRADNPARKLKYTWELVEAEGVLVGALPGRANALAEEAVAAGRIPALAGYERIRREVKYGVNSRIDLLLERDGAPPCHVEVKNVHMMREPGLAEFPDGVTARGTKHLAELAEVVRAGGRAVQLFVVQREDCQRFRPAADIDPVYAAALASAAQAGVEVIAAGCAMSPEGVEIDRPIAVELA